MKEADGAEVVPWASKEVVDEMVEAANPARGESAADGDLATVVASSSTEPDTTIVHTKVCFMCQALNKVEHEVT